MALGMPHEMRGRASLSSPKCRTCPFTLKKAGPAWPWAPALPWHCPEASGMPKSSNWGPCSGSLGPPPKSVQKPSTEHRPLATLAHQSPWPSFRARQLAWNHRLETCGAQSSPCNEGVNEGHGGSRQDRVCIVGVKQHCRGQDWRLVSPGPGRQFSLRGAGARGVVCLQDEEPWVTSGGPLHYGLQHQEWPRGGSRG